MSIASALIHATMSNVTRDMKQLEHWLGSLAAAPLASAPSMPSEVSSTTSDDIMRSLHAQQALLDQLHTTLHAQQHTIHHLTDRIQILEETRAVPETWMDPALEEEEEIVPIYIVRKTEEPVDQNQEALIQVTGQSVWKKESAQEVQEEEEVPVKQEEVPVKQVEVPVKKEEVPVKKEEVLVKKEEVLVKKEEVPVKKEEVLVKQEEEEEEEEEEEGMELEVIVFQGVSYYKDEEGFIYSIDEDEQPSEKAIGYWKKKAQAIAFYRSE